MCEGACSISQLSPFNLNTNEKRAHTYIHVHTHRYTSLHLRFQAIFSRLESSILSKCKHRLQRCIYMCMESSLGAMATYMKYPKGAINHKVSLNSNRATYRCGIVPAVRCVQVPRSIPAWQAAFIEPLACSVHAVELGAVQFRDTVVVAGCGPLGLGMVAAARLKNPTTLIALDLYDWKVW